MFKLKKKYKKIKEENKLLKKKIRKLSKIFCLECYKKLPNKENKFCPYCGIKLLNFSNKKKNTKKVDKAGWMPRKGKKELEDLFKKKKKERFK